jgi:heptosyltransferase-3
MPVDATPHAVPVDAGDRVLLIVPRRIGDVLLATPLLRSLRCAYPEARIEALVFSGTEGILAANPDVDRVIVIPERPTRREHLALFARIARRYRLAVSAVPGDRPTLYAWAAGRHRVGVLIDIPRERWKRRLLDAWVPFDDRDTHTIAMNLALADALGIPAIADVVVAWSPDDAACVDAALRGSIGPDAIAVLHCHPKFAYKMWTDEGWIRCAEHLARRGLRVALTGSADPAERTYLAALATRMPAGTLDLSGRLSLGATGCLIARARVFVGPDTVASHMAAATGTPTIVLFGPSNPVKWGPWPRAHRGPASPWRRLGNQRSGNVTLLQGSGACVPCFQEGCDRHVMSRSDCLDGLPAAHVLDAIDASLARHDMHAPLRNPGTAADTTPGDSR